MALGFLNLCRRFVEQNVIRAWLHSNLRLSMEGRHIDYRGPDRGQFPLVQNAKWAFYGQVFHPFLDSCGHRR